LAALLSTALISADGSHAMAFALDWLQYSKGRYSGAQREAERASQGIWKGSYVEPWLYRACIRASGTASVCSDDASAHP
jgi:endonuclease YncB( thermonuclease family)